MVSTSLDRWGRRQELLTPAYSRSLRILQNGWENAQQSPVGTHVRTENQRVIADCQLSAAR